LASLYVFFAKHFQYFNARDFFIYSPDKIGTSKKKTNSPYFSRKIFKTKMQIVVCTKFPSSHPPKIIVAAPPLLPACRQAGARGRPMGRLADVIVFDLGCTVSGNLWFCIHTSCRCGGIPLSPPPRFLPFSVSHRSLALESFARN